MVEMNEVANIVNNATKDSLIILDEVGRGTSTFDGLSIAWAVVEYLSKHLNAKTLFATHYHELTSLSDTYPLIKNFSIAVKEKGDDIVFLRKIVKGGADKSYGIQVAKLAGVPESVIKRAKEVLASVEGNTRASETGGKIAADISEKDDASMQIGFADMENSKVVEALRAIDVTTLTPIEAMNKLYELQKLL